MKTQVMIWIIALTTLGLWSCNEQIEPTPGTSGDELLLKSAEIAEDDLLTESILDEANFEVGVFADYEMMLRKLANYKGSKNLKPGNMGMRYKNDSNISVSIDTSETGYPILIAINYGDETILNNGRTLGGEVTIEVSAPRGTDGATRIINYNQCVFDSVTINGQYTETYTTDSDSLSVISSISNVEFTLPDSTVISRTGEHSRTRVSQSDSTAFGYNYTTTITGHTTLESSDGNIWERIIIDPVIRIAECRYPVQGIVQINQNGTLVAEIDFSNGTCDQSATLTANGETIDIELQEKPKAQINKNRENNNAKKQKGQENGAGNKGKKGGR